jgi:hypothetical protein
LCGRSIDPAGSCGALMDISYKNVTLTAGASYGANVLMLVNFDALTINARANVTNIQLEIGSQQQHQTLLVQYLSRSLQDLLQTHTSSRPPMVLVFPHLLSLASMLEILSCFKLRMTGELVFARKSKVIT